MELQLATIQSVPRSGSSWLGQIFASSAEVAFRFQPLFSYAFKGRLGPHSSREEILSLFGEIRATTDDFVLQRDPAIHVDHLVNPERANTTHVVMKEVRYNHIVRNLIEQVPELKVIGLVRHPCAVLDSWINAPREFKSEWSIEEEWRTGAKKNQGRPEEFFGFDKWKEVAQLFVDLEASHPAQMKVVRYADLNADPIPVVKEIFHYCGLEFGPATESFIVQSRSKEGRDANSVFRKVRPDTAWQGRLPEHIAATVIEELEGTPLVRFL